MAFETSGWDQINVVHKPRLLSENGSSYISEGLADYIKDNGMSHVRGAPYNPQTQGKIECWHQTLKNRILLENYFLPGDPERPMCLRRRHQRLMLSCLCGTGPYCDYQTRRHRHHGQSWVSQGKGYPSDHQGRWSKTMVSASILTRSKPNRADIFQNQTLDAYGTETNN